MFYKNFSTNDTFINIEADNSDYGIACALPPSPKFLGSILLLRFCATPALWQLLTIGLGTSITMKIATAYVAALIAAPFASAQSSAPSAASPLASFAPSTVESLFDSLAPTVVADTPSPTVDPRCNAHPLCLAEMLADNCCPTIENVFLDCCDMGDSAPTPAAATLGPTIAPTSSTTFGVSAQPSFDSSVADSAVPSGADAIAATPQPSTGAGTPAPTAGAGTPAPTAGAEPSIVTLTPLNYDGCMMVNGNGDDDNDFLLASCDATDEKQQFKFVGNQIQLAMDSSKCLQGGRNPTPSSGKYLRVYTCSDDEPLQMFTWEAPDGALTLQEFPNLAVVFRGTTANLNIDPIILGDLDDPEVLERKDWTILT